MNEKDTVLQEIYKQPLSDTLRPLIKRLANACGSSDSEMKSQILDMAEAESTEMPDGNAYVSIEALKRIIKDAGKEG